MEVTTRLKRKRVSKNKKKSWRKHTDITDVEEALDDERLQQRTGGLVAEKPDDSLFFVDKATEEDGVANKRCRRSLRCYANLEPDPNTAPPIIKHNGLRSKKVKRKGVLKVKKTKKQMMAEEQRRKAVRQRKLQQSASEALPVSSYDLWSGKNNSGGEQVDSFHLEYTRKKRVQAPSHYHEKSSALAAVDVPHPGASYNPAYDDHQELLSKALNIELEKARKERRLEKSLDEKFPSRDEAPTQETWLQEMSAGLFEGDEAPEDGTVVDEERLSVNPAVRREGKKTLRQRRIENKRKAKEKAQEVEKAKKLTAHELFRLKSIKAEVKAHETAMLKRQRRKAELKALYKDKPKKLGKHKFEEPEVEIKLSDELTGSLRELKPEGHILEDRFKAFQRRNVIETRKRAKFVRKYKPKKFEKKGHKAVTV